MPITLVNSVITETAPTDLAQFLRTGVMIDSQFALCDENDRLKQLKIDVSGLPTSTTVTIAPQATSSGTFSLPAIAGGVLASVADTYVSPYQYATPAAAGTVTITANKPVLVMEPAGTLATLTVVMPTAPSDGFIQTISSTAIVSVLTLSGGGSDTIVSALTALAAAGFAKFIYKASTAKWYRCG